MNDIRRYINILENASQDELQKYRDERAKYWPVSRELLAQYNDGSHTQKNYDGTLVWYQNYQLHRDNDLPAFIDADGALIWYQNGQRHRNGDKPAYINRDGTLSWYQNGQWHRDDDKPAVIGSEGTLVWYQNGKRHRDEDKPAFINVDGGLGWYQNNQCHRFSGPARIYPDGRKEWYWRGEKIPVNSQEEFIEWLKKHKGLQQFRVNKS